MPTAIKTLKDSSTYLEPEVARWLGSFEGLPEWVDSKEPKQRLPGYSKFHHLFEAAGVMLPGLALALAVGFLGKGLAHWLGVEVLGFVKSPFSAIMMSILLGLGIRNAIGLPGIYDDGLRFCLKKVLRIGIALLGIRLTLASAGALGLAAFPIVVACIAAALFFVGRISRWMGLPPRLGSLIAVGTSICGNSAIVATAPVIDADEDEISYAVGCVTIFGLFALMTYPFLSHWMFGGDPYLAGIFLGTGIHDTSQVVGAGMMYQQHYDSRIALETAMVTKLLRNLCMIGIIPLMAMLYRSDDSSGPSRISFKPSLLLRMVPLFVIAFLAMSVLRTVGDLVHSSLGWSTQAMWDALIAEILYAAKWCLIVAMASVGLGTDLSKLKKLGWKPLATGLFAASLVGCVSIGMIYLLSPFIRQLV